jgi:hypothetical protein
VHFHSNSFQNLGVERFASFENVAGPLPVRSRFCAGPFP